MAAPYHPDIPKGCPPESADSPRTIVYSAVHSFPVAEKELLSDAEKNRRGTDKAKCVNWGLSVWISEDAVAFAREILSFTRERYIVELNLIGTEGKIQHTPTNAQPEHYTFWRHHGLALAAQCQIYLPPLQE
jgi:hypothetical protein